MMLEFLLVRGSIGSQRKRVSYELFLPSSFWMAVPFSRWQDSPPVVKFEWRATAHIQGCSADGGRMPLAV